MSVVDFLAASAAAPRRWARGLACALLVAGLGTPALAQQRVGEVDFARGVGFAQLQGQAPRTLGKGLPLNEGDRLSTGAASFAIVRLQDGTRMTLRPNSDLVLRTYRYRENASDNSMVMQLFRGGFRAVTGLINKNAPSAASVQTATATIGIRGTDFDARLCANDCREESSRVSQPTRPNAVQASAKLAVLKGDVFAADGSGNRRRLSIGGAVYPGDLVETGSSAFALLAFRDQSRTALGSNSRLKIENFVFDPKTPSEGSFLVRLARGSMRALTGVIGKANPSRVGIATATATIGIRGTGFDLTCTGPCAEEAGKPGSGFTLYTWEGTVAVAPGGTGEELVPQGQGLFVGADGVKRVDAAPAVDAPRPDEVQVDFEALFGSAPIGADPEGLYVYVRDGHVEIQTGTEVLHLGRGEAGYATPAGDTTRPSALPLFIEFDRTPMPDVENPALYSLLSDLLPGTEVCR
ncbi:FecR family protein [Eleftheria terrae]|uniref:FecR family protein n=1 Tax=Eleftheria terrae TaxID=1597781 RepID=UPI00263BB5F9|nr:FecR domain-containing protein [Eleftheria terrae]WKB52139.1 FecR domain-containing protein [Eleftheria terrae]